MVSLKRPECRVELFKEKISPDWATHGRSEMFLLKISLWKGNGYE
jgi:hypothetical protein